MRIAHIEDSNVLDSIRDFYHPCVCDKYVLRKASPEEDIVVDELIIELSLACQGSCAFCCVLAPDDSNRYAYYSTLTEMLDLLNPKLIVVQGGEILIQPHRS